jgi:hypothetical protein
MTIGTLVQKESLTEAQRDRAVLDARYRCDKCGAQAYVRTILTNGGALYWCLHHSKVYIPVMKEQEILDSVYDEEIRLKEDRKKGSEN